MIFDFNNGFNNTPELLNPRPVIAISANIMDENSALHFAYSQAIVDAGAIPLIVPANCNERAITALMPSIDGLLLSGGADIDAQYFDQENLENLTEINPQRDFYEFMLLRAALDRGIPVLGICRGCQLVNVALGGSLFQDLPSLFPTEPLPHSILTNKHLPAHNITIEQDSVLYTIIGQETIGVNSRHHQAIDRVAEKLRVTARSSDGVVEAVEGFPYYNIIALQSHPENLATTGESTPMRNLFKFFVRQSDLYRRAKAIHTLNPIVDSHCDTPMLYNQGGFDFSLRNDTAQVGIAKMNEGLLDATITVAYIPQNTPQEIATETAFSILDRFKADIAKLSDKIIVVDSIDRLLEAKASGLRCIILGLENGLAIGNSLNNINRFAEEGVLYITLCHNGSNHICDSAVGDPLHNGISDFGAQVIQRMNSLGVTVDISHSSHLSTMDALRLSSQPIIASHSSCKALCDHPRNLSDEAIKAIAEKGGVVQICAYEDFLLRDGSATISDIVRHIEHVISLVGYEGVGIGSDFDGGGGVSGFQGANHFINLTVELLKNGHSEQNIAKIMGGNICRVLRNNAKK